MNKEIHKIKILHLSLKAEPYKMIESGVKTEEYREIKPYWCKRFTGMDKPMSSSPMAIQNGL